MSTHVVDRVDSWDERSFSGGYRALHELADEDFSGVVRASGAELYMTRGVVVGIRMGDIEDFEEANGTAYEAPAEALPLLAVMQERSDEVRAKYYSEDTPITKVDNTLSDGGFTGYIELSENVLSGDYYLVYHAGTSMAVAFVGESSKLIDGDEAFDTADDEVGIYEVRPVDVEPIEIPEPEEPAGDAGGGSADPTDGTSAEPQDGDSPAGAGAATTGSTAETGGAVGGSARTGAEGATADAAGETAQTDGEHTSERPAQEATTEVGSQQDSTTTEDGDTTATDRSQTTASNQTPAAGRTDEQATRTDEQATRTGEESKPTRADHQSARTDQGTRRTAEESPQQEQTREQEAAARTPDQQESNGTAVNRQQDAAHNEAAAGASSRGQGRDTKEETTTDAADRGVQDTAGQTQRGQPAGGTGQHRASATAGGASQDLEMRAVPSLDPHQTSIPDESPAPQTPEEDGAQQPPQDAQATQPAPDTTATQQPPKQEPQQPPEQNSRAQPAGDPGEPAAPGPQEPQPQQTAPQQGEAQQAETPAEPAGERVAELEEAVEQKESEIERLETELETATEERDDLKRQLEELEAERDELAAEVEELESQLAQLEEEFGAATDADRRLTPAEALAGTDIFVRYHSKGKATLEKAHGGSTRREDVNENMRLEKHTQFDAATASVGGQEYAEFLETTLEYQFVQWVVRDLLFEVRDTGHEKALRDLYDVLPKVDRAELSGTIRVTYTEDGQETQAEESFDVVLRDRMGNPLLVANLNDTREATTEAMMEGLITSAERVGLSSDTFAGAFYVTESFFDPSALEIAEESTKGGILSRDKRKSFVNLSRKNGYHLCLVEARNENFHLAVPEL
jgi:regulator of replication initiation timing